MYQRFKAADMLAHRRIMSTVYELTDDKRKIMLDSSYELIFDRSFFAAFPKLYTGMSLQGIGVTLGYAKAACRHLKAKTLGDLVSMRYSDIIHAYGMGAKTVAFMLDTLQAFGFQIKGTPPRQPNDAPTTGAELAQLLHEA